MKNRKEDNTPIVIRVELTERPVVKSTRVFISATEIQPASKKVKLEPTA